MSYYNALLQASDDPSVTGNIFINFFAPLCSFSLNDLILYLSSTVKTIKVVSVNNDITIRRGKVCAATGVVS